MLVLVLRLIPTPPLNMHPNMVPLRVFCFGGSDCLFWRLPVQVYINFDKIPGIDLKEPLKCMNDNFEHWERENAKFAAEAAKEEEEATKAMVEGEEEEEGEEKD